MAFALPRGLAVIDHPRQSQQLCADPKLALPGGIQIHDKANSVFLCYKLHRTSGFGKPIDVADGHYTGKLDAGQDLGHVRAFRSADKENVTSAQIIAETLFSDDDAAGLDRLSRDDI